MCHTDLLACQVSQPLDEAEDRKTISALTAIDDTTSLQAMSQYEENPYPRWTVTPRLDASQIHANGRATEILVAGCGTGRHALEVAQQSPNARILGIDISRSSLGYARRKTREAGFRNVEFAQADILKLGSIGRSFDRIEAIGVLHHLADPEAGLRVLLSLLKPEGTLRLGLYSETARRGGSVVEARDFIASGGYQPTPEGIRSFRSAIIARRSEPRWRELLTMSADFYSMSGCRDLLFNVMEHRYTIPQIAQVLKAHSLSLIDFQIDPIFVEQFRYQFPSPDAAINLDQLHAFEQANPLAFRRMYMFTVCKNARTVDEAHYQQR
jgi:ubiquinone/menaquinone biosynthesis C-methylase UbiE